MSAKWEKYKYRFAITVFGVAYLHAPCFSLQYTKPCMFRKTEGGGIKSSSV